MGRTSWTEGRLLPLSAVPGSCAVDPRMPREPSTINIPKNDIGIPLSITVYSLLKPYLSMYQISCIYIYRFQYTFICRYRDM